MFYSIPYFIMGYPLPYILLLYYCIIVLLYYGIIVLWYYMIWVFPPCRSFGCACRESGFFRFGFPTIKKAPSVYPFAYIVNTECATGVSGAVFPYGIGCERRGEEYHRGELRTWIFGRGNPSPVIFRKKPT